MKDETTRVVPGRLLGIFAMLVACFALWGALNNMTDNLVPAFQKIFTMDQSRAGLVQVAFYGAYAVLAIFASILIEEFSYRKGVLVGLGVYIIGALLYIPACIMQSFDIYFVAIFVVAGGCSLLETACNPYVLALGDQSTAVRRLNFAQMFNPVGSIMGIFMAKELILAHLNPATTEERMAMAPDALAEIVRSELFWVCAPYVGLCAIAGAIWLFFLIGAKRHEQETALAPSPIWPRFRRTLMAAAFSLVPLTALYFAFPEMDKVLWVVCGTGGPIAYIILMSQYRAMLATLLKTPRYILGVVAQFFYVGVQIAAWTWMNAYCQQEFGDIGMTKDTAAGYYLCAIIVFVTCRWITTALMKKFNPASMMALFAAGAIASCAGVIWLPTKVLFHAFGLPFSANILCLIAMSGFMSLMFPTIYGIALGGLDSRAVKLGAAGLIMAILGGAVITPWMASVMGNPDTAWTKLVPAASTLWNTDLKLCSASIRAAFAIPAICFAVVLAYSLLFNKKPNIQKGETK